MKASVIQQTRGRIVSPGDTAGASGGKWAADERLPGRLRRAKLFCTEACLLRP